MFTPRLRGGQIQARGTFVDALGFFFRESLELHALRPFFNPSSGLLLSKAQCTPRSCTQDVPVLLQEVFPTNPRLSYVSESESFC